MPAVYRGPTPKLTPASAASDGISRERKIESMRVLITADFEHSVKAFRDVPSTEHYRELRKAMLVYQFMRGSSGHDKLVEAFDTQGVGQIVNFLYAHIISEFPDLGKDKEH